MASVSERNLIRYASNVENGAGEKLDRQLHDNKSNKKGQGILVLKPGSRSEMCYADSNEEEYSILNNVSRNVVGIDLNNTEIALNQFYHVRMYNDLDKLSSLMKSHGETSVSNAEMLRIPIEYIQILLRLLPIGQNHRVGVKCLQENGDETSIYMKVRVTKVSEESESRVLWYWTKDQEIAEETDNIDEIATCKPRCRLFNGRTLLLFPDCCQLQFVNKPTMAKCTGCILIALFGVFAIFFALYAALISS